MALSVLGSDQRLVKIAMDETYRVKISFRSLLEIMKAYKGDKEKLFGELLKSPDNFFVRVSVKRIGAERLRAHGEKIMPFLMSTDDELVMDTIRTLGKLRVSSSEGAIASLLKHERWEIRSLAVTALAEINVLRNAPRFVAMLGDSEWQVRLNAAVAIAQTPGAHDVLREIEQGGDRYATDILRYTVSRKDIRAKGAA